jgi:hypothetical protein
LFCTQSLKASRAVVVRTYVNDWLLKHSWRIHLAIDVTALKIMDHFVRYTHLRCCNVVREHLGAPLKTWRSRHRDIET